MFVIVHKETGKLVAMPGSEHSYTSAGKGDAMVFRTKENAQRPLLRKRANRKGSRSVSSPEEVVACS